MAARRILSRNLSLSKSILSPPQIRVQQLCNKRFGSAEAKEVNEEGPMTFAERYANRCKDSGKVKLMVGDYCTAEKQFTADDVQMYADITGDDNPVHSITSDTAAQEMGFNASICHGMFSGTLFSAAVGGSFPGAILVETTMKWKKPLYINESMSARVEVKKVMNRRKLAFCNIVSRNGNDEVVVEGSLTMLVRDLEDSK